MKRRFRRSSTSRTRSMSFSTAAMKPGSSSRCWWSRSAFSASVCSGDLLAQPPGLARVAGPPHMLGMLLARRHRLRMHRTEPPRALGRRLFPMVDGPPAHRQRPVRLSELLIQRRQPTGGGRPFGGARFERRLPAPENPLPQGRASRLGQSGFEQLPGLQRVAMKRPEDPFPAAGDALRLGDELVLVLGVARPPRAAPRPYVDGPRPKPAPAPPPLPAVAEPPRACSGASR
jgi:hypothetical protein